jgi:rhodanese-related sulfurtransferase
MRRPSARRILAGAAALAGALALFAGSPYLHAGRRSRVDFVSAVDLGGWIRDSRAGLRILDIRPSSEFADGHVPGAENVTIESLRAIHFGKGKTLVIVSDHGESVSPDASQFVMLRGGEQAWLDEVMHPLLPERATERGRPESLRIASISRYFGGSPRIGNEGSVPESRRVSAATAAAIARRRGC